MLAIKSFEQHRRKGRSELQVCATLKYKRMSLEVETRGTYPRLTSVSRVMYA